MLIPRTCLVALLASFIFGSAYAEETGAQTSQLADLLGSDADPAFARAIAPRAFVFPQDHGPHPEFRNEWWYVTGNLDNEDGERFGFELTIFRFALTPSVSASKSAWRTNQVYIAHLAVTDADNKRFYVAQRYSRGAAGLAGAQAKPFRVWIDDWEMAGKAEAGTWHLIADDEDFGIDLELRALKPPVLNGIDGLSQKSADPSNASYYYSITRLQTEGSLRIGENDYTVSGLSWLDREWSTSALAADQVGWDWFALQLDDGSELMIYGLRLENGTRDPASAGTFVSANGVTTHLAYDDVEISVLEEWSSPEGGSYPSRWLLRVPRFGLELNVTPVISDQELFTTVRYWEGAVDVTGEHELRPVEGRGYVELTGYAEE
ncbi:MAG: carotenoid 1,2-hydratase [Gammaproteobacteria bacterium]|jgi:predicted secreted hydrolase|nr:carotenoid 1,2-hydratase [Gammaproteobacteria bacterium]